MRIASRSLVAVAALSLLAGCATTGQRAGSTATPPTASASAPSSAARGQFTDLEKKHDARLGVYAIDTGSGTEVAFRADERFGYASTYKALAAAAVLDNPPVGGLDSAVDFSAGDLVTYSPITEQHTATGMTLRELADAAIRYSDNTAGNLLFDALGGPSGFETALRSIGDDVTDAEHREPELNTLTPGATADTSTPRALATDLKTYALGSALSADDKAQLQDWLVGNTTGAKLIRASVPAGWKVGDKTGSADHGTRNDIAVIWPPDAAPIVIAVLSDHTGTDAETDDALVAAATGVALRVLGATRS